MFGTNLGLNKFSFHFLDMLKRNLTLTIRLLLRQRIYSIINLLGLSLGMACFFVIVMFYQYQNSYDQFHTKKDHIFRLNRSINHNYGNEISRIASNTAGTLIDNITGVEKMTRLVDIQTDLQYGDIGFNKLFLYAAEDSFFEIFDFKLLAGNSKTALSDINTIVLSESLAKKYFGSESALSKIMSIVDKNGKKVDLTVSGIMKDIPPNSHLMIDALLSYSSLKSFFDEEQLDTDWSLCNTYLLLNNNINPTKVEKDVSTFILDQMPEDSSMKISFRLQALTDIFFNPTSDGGSQQGNQSLTNIFLLLGIIILLVASLNYINLATARSLKRSREVGIRKVTGATRKQLIYQFLGESILICIVAFFISLFLINLIIPYINNFSNNLYRIQLDPKMITAPKFILIATCTVVITGLLSGSYPAFVISSFLPSKSLKGERQGKGNYSTRKTLVVVQYVVSIILVISCLAIYKVFDHIKNQNFGFDNENILAINVQKLNRSSNIDEFRASLASINGIEGMSYTSKIPLSHRDDIYCRILDERTDYKNLCFVVFIDETYFDFLGINTIQNNGNDLNKEATVNGIYVNEAFIKRYGQQYALGSTIELFNNTDDKKVDFTYEIIGIVENIKLRVLEQNIEPAIFKIDREKSNYLLVQIDPKNQSKIVSSIESVFKTQNPFLVFDYTFLDDEMEFMFSMINPFAKLVYYATLFAIFIASIGLFALALFVTQQRRKEIGIRKTYGASQLNVSLLLARQFVKLVFISFLLSGPLTFFGFRWILLKFNAQLEMNWSLLVAVGAGIVILSTLTVLGQSWNAARSNPVSVLQTE